MKVKIADILANLDMLAPDTLLFGGKPGSVREMINNQPARGFRPNIRTGNFWRAEITEQGNVFEVGVSVIHTLAQNPHAVHSGINIPDRFIGEWVFAALECIATARCISLVDEFEFHDFLEPKIRNMLVDKNRMFKTLSRLPRKFLLEMARILLLFNNFFMEKSKNENCMNDNEAIFQHGFVMDADPKQIVLREFWNSTFNAEGMARVTGIISEEEFTGRKTNIETNPVSVSFGY